MSWTITGSEKTPVDPQFGSVSLLLHGNGTNGSTTITDSSPSPKTVTAVGNAQISTAQSKFGGTSIAFDGTGDYLTIPDSVDFFYPADFTVEFWYRFAVVPTGSNVQYIYNQRNSGFSYFLIYSTSTSLVFDTWMGTSSPGTQGPTITASTTHSNTNWTHFALTRSANVYRMFLDGAQVGTQTNSAAILDISASLDIGRWSGGSGREFNGYIDELRITKGVARYTADFTPPTAPFPDI